MAESARMKQLQQLAGQIPGANADVAKGLQEAQTTQLQAQIGAMRPGQGGPQAAQQMGAQQQAKAGQAALQSQEQTQQQLGQVAGMGLQQRGLETTQRLGATERANQKMQRKFANELNSISNDAKNKLLDRQLDFKKDQANKTLFNTRQLLDFAATQARDAEEFKSYAQAAEKVQKRKLQRMQATHAKLEQAIKQGYVKEGKRLDQESRERLIRLKNDMERRLKDASDTYDETTHLIANHFSVAGSVMGAVF